MKQLSLLLCITYLLLLPIKSFAKDNLFITGIDITENSSNYMFAGALLPLPDNSLAHGLVLHLWLDNLTYQYESGPNLIKAKGNSLSAGLAYHDSDVGYWWNAKIGASYAKTRLTPDDLNNKSRGNITDLKLGLAGERHLSENFKANVIIDYGVDREAYWSRLRLLHHITEGMYHGPEFISQGDPYYDVKQYGWAIEGISIGHGVSIGLKAGVRKDDYDRYGYAGLDLVIFF